MNFNFLISFGVAVGLYLLIMGIIVLVKWHKNKKSFKKEVSHHESKQEEKK